MTVRLREGIRTSVLVWYERVPYAVEVGGVVVEKNGDVIAASRQVLGVEGLMNITKEMHHEAQGLTAVESWQGEVRDPRSVIGDGTHDAPAVGGQTVARDVDATLTRGVVLRVDVVPGRSVGERRHVADFVGEESRFGNVLTVEEVVGECGGSRGEVERC